MAPGFLDQFLGSCGFHTAANESGGRRPVCFATGVRTPETLRLHHAAGIPVAVELADLASDAGEALVGDLRGMRGTGFPVLLDCEGRSGHPTKGALRVDGRRLAFDLAGDLGAQLYLALAPGLDQATLLREVADQALDWRRMEEGAHVLLPMQKGILRADELQAEAQEILGRSLTPMFDMGDWRLDELEAFVQATAPVRLHLTGSGGRATRLKAARRIWELAPQLLLSESRALHGKVWPDHADAAQFQPILPAVMRRLVEAVSTPRNRRVPGSVGAGMGY